ncbi:hypothetical protein V9T40_003653 [Parthenolecanium corni]|uniref:RRM domain-containing protein n=1 Tax=Parthenolecanium corni TaxID=536013 RepID=A0AAN9TR16_9HEMI
MSHQSIIDKTARIVFVSNIPLEIPEDKLKDLFGKIGPILSFKLIYDKESGKSRGCAVCEYKEQDLALTAMKTLNNVELGGRNLKVDHALNEKSRLEMISVMQGNPISETNNASEKTPETISKAVASLPPEQMFELLKQMKQCVQNNAAEAKNMLLQNPQLAYALLQALVVMRIVDPQVAFTALSNSGSAASSSVPYTSNSTSDSSIAASNMIHRIATPLIHSGSSDSKSVIKPPSAQPSLPVTTASRSTPISQPVPPPAPSMPFPIVPPPAPVVHDVDMRSKILGSNRVEPDRAKPEQNKRDPRLQLQDSKLAGASRAATVPSAPPVSVPPAPSAPRLTPATPLNPSTTKAATSSQDNEKAALIMQVLRLTDAQIALLPPEQRQSIMMLKEQIAKSTKR